MSDNLQRENRCQAERLDYLLYLDDPDYRRPVPGLPAAARQRLRRRLEFLYGPEKAGRWLPEIERLLRVHQAHKTAEITALERTFDPEQRFSERDVALITYGDLLKTRHHSPLAGLAAFLDAHTRLRQVINILHILPFFPYSSDRGFSVTDFRTVDPHLGSWRDIAAMTGKYRLMFDGVFNHISARSRAFKEMLNGNPRFRDLVIYFRSPDELTPEQRQLIVRPRTSDLLTRFDALDGPLWVWTTFSPDQVDLNFKNPAVLAAMIDTLLLYVRKGANLVRLDAVTYLWAEPGTPSVHLEQTHEIIRLLRDILDLAAPNVALVTETNVPHQDNIAYFGNGTDEAQMVYNFTLPPLVLHAFYREDATALSRWAANLEYPSRQATFFNILDTHDGIGLMGVKDILPPAEIDFLVSRATASGAFISYRSLGDGDREPYEINSTWFSALNGGRRHDSLELQARRFVASRSLALALRGVPGIYFHGLIGSENRPEVVEETGSKRDINRVMIDEKELLAAAANPDSRLMLIVGRLLPLLQLRTANEAFHPNADQQVLELAREVFALRRTPMAGDRPVLALTNVASRACKLRIPRSELGEAADATWVDLVDGRRHRPTAAGLALTLAPYAVAWLTPAAG
ncbi:MAG: sugar phosphorylase [Deltaproteobacteria bacterium]|nr:sugar phosphorylase [Deltaproteobacteria bacterium]